MYDYIELFKNKQNNEDMVISWPFDAIHKTHFHLDTATGELSLGTAADWKSKC